MRRAWTSKTWKKAALAALGLSASAALILWVFFEVRLGPPVRLQPRFALGAWLSALPSHFGAYVVWLIPFLLLTAALAPLRAVLWGTTLPRPVPSFGTRLLSIALGGLVHNVLPGRLGLLGSAYVLARRSSGPVAGAFGSLLLAKLLELGALVAVTAAALGVLSGRGLAAVGFARLIGIGVAALLLLSVGALALSRFAPRDVPPTAAHARFRRLHLLLGELAAGLSGLGSPRRLVQGFCVGLGPVVAAGLAYGFALERLGAPVGLLGGPLVLAAVTLGQMTPGLPIGAGVHYAVAAWAGRSMGLAAEEAAALAALSHAATVVANLGVGVTAAIARRASCRR